jgi:very-short-patch-repair endonuclease
MHASQLEHALAFQLHYFEKLDAVRELRFAPPRRWRFDFAFPPERIAIEVNGALGRGRHSRLAGQEADYEKLNAALELGWRVLVYGPTAIRDGTASLQIGRLVRAARVASRVQLQACG